MKPEPFISLVTPSFNQGKFIRQTIESILRQDYPHFELWVIDGGSTDETLSILAEYEKAPRFHWLSEKDSGQSNAINKGFARCSGEIFNWINSDDYLEPGALRQVAQFFSSQDVDVICGVCRKFEDLTNETTGFMQTELKGNTEETILLGRICQQGTFIRSTVFRSLGGVREDLHCAMDWHYWTKYLVANGLNRVKRCNSLLAHFRQHPESKTGKAASQFKQEINAIFLDLFTTLHAPEWLISYLKSLTALDLLPTAWKPYRCFSSNRLFAGYCNKIVKLYYHDQAYDRAWVWLWRSFTFQKMITLNFLRFFIKIIIKRNILKQGYKF